MICTTGCGWIYQFDDAMMLMVNGFIGVCVAQLLTIVTFLCWALHSTALTKEVFDLNEPSQK